MKAPDVSAFEGVPLVGAEITRSTCIEDIEEPRLEEEGTKKRANYEKWDRIAKICFFVFGCLYLATHFSEDDLIKQETHVLDDDTTVWEGGEEQRQMEKRVAWQDKDFVLFAPVVSDEALFQLYLKDIRNTFVAFNAPWCPWSQRMRPTWHKFAAVSRNIQVLEVDCGQAPSLCKKESVLAFPTMRWYRDGKRFGHAEYAGDRTINAFLVYSDSMIHQEDASPYGNVLHEARSITFSNSEGETRSIGYSDSEEKDEDEESSQVNTGWAGVPEQWHFATSLTRETFDEFITSNKNSFVTFTTQAYWCNWCHRMRPSWHQFALVAKHAPLDVGIAEVDCMAQANLCRDLDIVAFPTLRWFRNSQPIVPDYELGRPVTGTVMAFVSHSRAMLSQVHLHEELVPNKLNEFIGNGGSPEEMEEEKDKQKLGQAKEHVGSEGQPTVTSSKEDEAKDQVQATDITGSNENAGDALLPLK